MTKWNKEIQCEQIWWLITAYTVKLIFSTSTYQRSFPCIDHWWLQASPATSYLPPIRFIDQKTKILALQKSDEFSFGFEIVFPRVVPRTETVAKLTKKKWKKKTPDPEINFKRFWEGATLHLFLIFARVEIKISGLISDRCRSFFSSSKWYLPNSICGAL